MGGFEGAGTVVAVGPDTSGRLRVGDEVWGLSGSSNLGTYADFHSVPEDAYFVRPTSISADDVIDYHVSNWWDVLENGTVHAIFDTVGQIGTGPRATAMLAKDGVSLTIAHKGPSVGLDPNPQSNVAQIYE